VNRLIFLFQRAAGIGILVVVLAALLIIGCWYYTRRSGYTSLLSKNFRVAGMKTFEDKSALLGSKVPLQEYSTNGGYMVPDAPPAYDKVSASSLPPPYVP
uniref:Melan-A n=1 Tax=Varanus komodoensis TaxID=61221 RepID=A0A8D2L780_VARKO